MIILVTGGTGGHVFPALALSDILNKNNIETHIIVDQRGVKYIDLKQYKTFVIPIQRQNHIFKKLFYPFSLATAFFKNIIFFIKNRPEKVIGFGGYTTIPSILAAYILRIPIIIHEGNSFLGKANRFLQHIASQIFTSFPNTHTQYPKKTLFTGLPLRQNILQTSFTYTHPTQTHFNILIIGGSQGAQIFSTILPQAIQLLPLEIQQKIAIRQQVRKENLENTRKLYKKTVVSIELKTFFDVMEKEYQNTHLVITRSGASTLFELAYAKKPAILFPYASSLEGDQAKNASFFEKKNASWVLCEQKTTPQNLAALLENIIKNPNLLEEKSQHIEKLFPVDFEKIIIQNII